MISKKIFAKRLLSLRNSKNLTQQQLGISLGTKKQSVNNWENCVSIPTLDMLAKIANFFNVPIDYLIGNGIYSNWDKILEIKPVIIDELIRLGIPENIIDKVKNDDNLFLKSISSIIDGIDIDDDKKIIRIRYFF